MHGKSHTLIGPPTPVNPSPGNGLIWYIFLDHGTAYDHSYKLANCSAFRLALLLGMLHALFH
jgi:hypothetical protein